MDVGVRELKQHLSEYLERAANGETFRVTDRGHPKAWLGPLPERSDAVARGMAEGWVSLGDEAGPLGPVAPLRGRRRVLDALEDDRGA